jgi:c-di-GMP-binding flagellar brake protein YcgR
MNKKMYIGNMTNKNNGYNGSERRRFPRASARIVYSKVKNPKYVGNEAYTKDISVGGLCFIAKEPVDFDEELSLDIVLPSGELFNVFAKVLRCIEIDVSWDAKKHYKVGLSFLDISERAKQAIDNYLKRFIPDQA